MKKLGKKMITLITLLAICLFCSISALGEKLFDERFIADCHLQPEEIYKNQCVAPVGNTVYQLMRNGDIFAWDSQTDEYALYAHVPKFPSFNSEIPFHSQSDSIKAEIEDTVFYLISSPDGLYGINLVTGAIGLIDANGIHFNNVKLDTSFLKPSTEEWPMAFANAFIENEKLYAYFDIGLLTGEMPPQTTLLIFDLITGDCSTIYMENTIAFCRYTSGKLLLLQDDGTETPKLAIYDIASEKSSDLDLVIPISMNRNTFQNSWEIHSEIGGLAYDSTNNTTYLSDVHGVWISIAGQPFERQSSRSGWDMLIGTAEAWVLSSGDYVFQNGWAYYIKP